MNYFKNQSSNTKLIILLLSVLVIILIASFIVTMVKNDGDGSVWTESTENGTVAFNTPVGTLTYPHERAQYIKIQEKTDEISYTATLYGEVAEKEFKLFSIYINEKTLDSFPLGNITDDNGNVYSVSMAIEDLETDESWSNINDEDKDLLYAMQEDVNYIVEQIKVLPGFAPAY